MQKGKILIATAIALAIVCSAYLISVGFRHFSGGDNVIRVTGVSERHIVSDLATITIEVRNYDQKQSEAYNGLEIAKNKVLAFIQKEGFAKEEIASSGTEIVKGYGERKDMPEYAYYSDRNFIGYRIISRITVSSNKIDKVDELSSSISQLLAEGIDVEARNINFYYTKLDELKREMLKEASANALERASIIAEGGHGKLGEIKHASMGVFQIVGRYQPEDYSWGGTLNTSSKEKTASVTVKASYIIE